MVKTSRIKKIAKKVSRRVYKATGMVNPIKKGRLSTYRLAKDVAFLKSVLNPEKKDNVNNNINTAVGQVNGNSSGHSCLDLTPIIPQGITGQTRNGNSVKIHSMVIKGQILQQSGNHHQGKIKIQLFLNMGTPFTTFTGADIGNLYSVNPVNNVCYDVNSSRATDTFKNWRLLSTKNFYIKQDNYSGVQGWKTFTIPLRFKSYHVKYDDTNGNTVTNGQLIMVLLADSGNRSSSVVSTVANIPIVGVSTGFEVRMFQQYWFYDN